MGCKESDMTKQLHFFSAGLEKKKSNISSTSIKVFLQGRLYYHPLSQVRTQVQKDQVSYSDPNLALGLHGLLP